MISVLTTPGCSDSANPPSIRQASARVKRILYSLDREYALGGLQGVEWKCGSQGYRRTGCRNPYRRAWLIEDTLMMRKWGLRTSRGSSRWQRQKWPRWLTAQWSQWPWGVRVRVATPMIPALLIRQSTCPVLSLTSRANCLTLPRSLKSKCKQSTVPPSALIDSASSLDLPISLAPMMTLQPRRASALTTSPPIPPLPPVMTATLPPSSGQGPVYSGPWKQYLAAHRMTTASSKYRTSIK